MFAWRKKPPSAHSAPFVKGAAKPPGRFRRIGLGYSLLAAAAWLFLLGGIFGSYALNDLPNTANLLVYEAKNDITILDVEGRLIARRGLTRAGNVAVEDLPPYVGRAFIAIEDRRFYWHFGIDPLGLARAVIVDLWHMSFVQGGSTITQQLAKNLFLQPDRTLKRKAQEALLAMQLERRYSKNEILSLYINRVYFGAGVYGIEGASQRFFSKSARALTLTEAAILAGSVKAPSRYNPATDPDGALARAGVVLQAMERSGFIDLGERQLAQTTRPKVSRNMATPGAGYFVDHVISQIPAFAGRLDELSERLIVDTTLDIDMQAAAERALTAGLARDGPALNAGQGAMVVMTPDGALRAHVGGRSYDDSPFDRAVDARRQPGSAFKVFIYLAALESGHRPSDRMFDGPVSIGNWAPDNYGGNYEGEMTLAYALAHSSNSVAVQLIGEVGPAQVARVAHRLGITSMLQEVPALALGTSEISPMELVTGYAAFANGGTAVIPYSVLRIRTASGVVLYERHGSGFGRVMSPARNAEMTDMLVLTVTEGTGRAARLADRPVAGKTGTSQDYRDAWFVGFTSNLVTGVWIGNDDNTPMERATGAGLPARIFNAFMTEAEADLPALPLAGTRYRLAANVAVENQLNIYTPITGEAEETRNRDLIGAFQNLLDSLF